MATKNYALTTVDNPHNPFENFPKWYDSDVLLGHYTTNKLANRAMTSEELTEDENNDEMMSALDQIIADDPLNLYVKVTEDDYKDGKWLKERYQKPPERQKEGIGG